MERPLFRIVVWVGTTHVYNAWDYELVCGLAVHPSSLDPLPDSDVIFSKCADCSAWIDRLIESGDL